MSTVSPYPLGRGREFLGNTLHRGREWPQRHPITSACLRSRISRIQTWTWFQIGTDWATTFPSSRSLYGLSNKHRPLSPSLAFRDPARGQASGSQVRISEAGRLSYAPQQLCHPPSRGWIRHSRRPGIPRSQERPHHDDLHPRTESRWAGRPQPC